MAWLAPHLDRLLGDVAVLPSPFFGSGKLEYYLAARRPGLEVRGVDAFKPVANLRRCYLRRDPVFLRSLWGATWTGASGRVERPGCLRVRLLRNSFSGKWVSFTQQRPLALSSVRRLQQPPCNVTVRRQDALAYLRALPRLAHQCIYADPPYIFPGRSMNYYGTRGGHDLVFHSELRDALFASGLPFVVSVNDVRRPGSSTAGPTPSQACARARTVPSPSCCAQPRIEGGNPAPSSGLTRAILCSRQA